MLFFTEILKQALQQIRAYALRSALTGLGIVIAVTGLVAIAAVMQGLDKGVNRVLSQLGSDLVTVDRNYLRNNPKSLSKKEWQELQTQVQGIGTVVASSRVPGYEVYYGDKKFKLNIIAASESHPRLYQQYPVQGRFLMASDEAARHRVCVISEHLIRTLGLPEQVLGNVIHVGSFSLEIIGVVPGNGEAEQGLRQIGDVYMPFSVAEELVGQERSYEFGFRILDLKQREEVVAQVKTVLRKSLGTLPREAEDFILEDSQEIRESALLMEKMISKVFLAVVAVSLLVGGIGIMNVMLVSVTERTHEIGILMALGATKQHIRFQFLMEAILLSVMGAVLGVLSGWGLANFIVQFIPRASTPSVPMWALISAVGVSISVALISGAMPAARAADLDPVVALSKD